MKLLLYCTKAKPYITQGNDGSVYPSCVISDGIKDWHLNGKIVAECDFEVEEIKPCISPIDKKPYAYMTRALERWELVEHSCLSFEQLDDYLKGEKGYAIHIKDLHIFDKPRFIQDYSKNENPYNYIENAPQNMCYAYDVKSFNNFEKSILISIRPEWLCKILNGEKTIEVRKRVLKEMLKNV